MVDLEVISNAIKVPIISKFLSTFQLDCSPFQSLKNNRLTFRNDLYSGIQF